MLAFFFVLKIYDEKKTMRWNSESRIKSIIYADSYIPQQQYFKVDTFTSFKIYFNFSAIFKRTIFIFLDTQIQLK